MRIEKLICVGALAFGVSFYAAAEDAAPILSGDLLIGLIQSDSGHVYNRDHKLPGDPGFDDNVYEFRVTSASIKPRRVVTAWLFCLDTNKERIGGIVDDFGLIMGGRLDGNIGAPILEDKVHVGFLCGLPSKSENPNALDQADDVAYAEDVSYAEIVLVDHGKPVKGIYLDPKGEKVEGVMLQLMNRPEDDPFCNGTYQPRRKCKPIGSGIVPLHRHPVRGSNE